MQDSNARAWIRELKFTSRRSHSFGADVDKNKMQCSVRVWKYLRMVESIKQSQTTNLNDGSLLRCVKRVLKNRDRWISADN